MKGKMCKCYYILGKYQISAHRIKTTQESQFKTNNEKQFAGFVRQF